MTDHAAAKAKEVVRQDIGAGVRPFAPWAARGLDWARIAGGRLADATRGMRRFERDHEGWAHGAAALGGLLAVSASLIPGAPSAAGSDASRILKLAGGDLSDKGLAAFAASMDPAAVNLAQRFAPPPPVVLPGTGPNDANDPGMPPTINLPALTPEAARLLNASIPLSTLPNPAAQPFRLHVADLLDETRAIDCLTAAIYYEAGMEPREGQQAVAQVVLNRMRHPAFPKSVCGVVFQGANRTTGCQFTFTCDGSLGRRPTEAGWRRAREVAVAALNGFVMKSVGNATHYHAVYVAPYWSSSLIKVANIGAHVFYRWTGGWGQPLSFAGAYAGAEPEITQIAATSSPSLDALIATALAPGDPQAPAAAAAPATDQAQPATLDAAAPAPTETAAAAPATVVTASETPASSTPPVAQSSKPKPKPEVDDRRRRNNWDRLPIRSTW